LIAQFLIKLKPRLAGFIAVAEEIEHIRRMVHERLMNRFFDGLCHGVAPLGYSRKGSRDWLTPGSASDVPSGQKGGVRGGLSHCWIMVFAVGRVEMQQIQKLLAVPA
jgi:hypothetical protein